ncbi:MAG: hypothetical protein LBG58_02265 [Planctomycetaceae bacterium]|nr:hypothetical protein [Planctomycetaceae bacterium]
MFEISLKVALAIADSTVAGASPLPKIQVLTATGLPTQLFRQRGRYRHASVRTEMRKPDQPLRL